MIKTTLYPKTKRYSDNISIQITEKMDGSNLSIGKLNGELLIFQRNYMFKYSEIEGRKGIIWSDLYSWLIEHHDCLLEQIYEGSIICGEWLGKGIIKYRSNIKFYMFAKGRFKNDLIKKGVYVLDKMEYNLSNLHYVFLNQEIPNFIKLIPLVSVVPKPTDLNYLNNLYDEYSKQSETKVEGFIIFNGFSIKKYVRYKDKKFIQHHE